MRLFRHSTSGVSTGNVLGYYRNLGSLRYGMSTVYFTMPGSCTTQSSLQLKQPEDPMAKWTLI